MESYRFGRNIEDLTVKDVVTMLKYARDSDGMLPEEYRILLSGNMDLCDDFRSLGLAQVEGNYGLRITDLGMRVLEHFEKSKRLSFPTKFAQKIAEMSEASKHHDLSFEQLSEEQLAADVERGLEDAKKADYDAKQAPRLRRGR